MIHLVLGGARAGKSRFALSEAEAQTGKIRFVATATALDDEMRDRVRRHREERGDRHRTVEAPRDLPSALGPGDEAVVVLDCLTMWVANFVMVEEEPPLDALAAALLGCPLPLLVVSNEVGLGIVPDNPLSRRYRDALGRTNQRVASLADRVTLVVAGIPMKVK